MKRLEEAKKPAPKRLLQPLLLGLVLLLCATAKAEITVESIDVNKTPIYTLQDYSIDINISSTENKTIVIQLLDNNTIRKELITDVNSSDGNKQYHQYSFVMQFQEGTRFLDVNVSDLNHGLLAYKQTSFLVLANPLIGSEELSWTLIQTYVLPIARSLSECLVAKTDLNVAVTQAHATMKAQENDVAIALIAKQAAEDLVAKKTMENEACNSAKATLDADKTTLESKLTNAVAKCDTEKNQLKDDEQGICDEKLLIKDDGMGQRDLMILNLSQEKNTMEALATSFGVLFFVACGSIGFMYYKKMIKI